MSTLTTETKPTELTLEDALRLACDCAIEDSPFSPNEDPAGQVFWNDPRGCAEGVVEIEWDSQDDDDGSITHPAIRAAWGHLERTVDWQASAEREFAIRFCTRCLCLLMSEEDEGEREEHEYQREIAAAECDANKRDAAAREEEAVA